MGKNPLVKAKVKKTGIIVEVYKLDSGGWCDFSDCTTTYTKEKLDFKVKQ